MRENILVQYARAIVNDHGPVPSHVGKGAVWPLNKGVLTSVVHTLLNCLPGGNDFYNSTTG